MESAEFVEFISARLPQLRRAAYLLCGDLDRGDDVVQRTVPTEPASNTTIDGHRAKVDFSERSGRVDLFNVDGHTVTVFVYSAESMDIDEAEAIALVRSVSLVNEPADLSNWTDSPLR